MSRQYNYFVYILTNKLRTVIHTGVTNNPERRLIEHERDAMLNVRSFSGRYKCIYLIYFEHHDHIDHAIEREKRIKGWNRRKKESLINSLNPDWKFLNDRIRDI